MQKEKAIMAAQEESFFKTWHSDCIALVGDAVHKSTSINGLGANYGLHSAAVLAIELLTELFSGIPISA